MGTGSTPLEDRAKTANASRAGTAVIQLAAVLLHLALAGLYVGLAILVIPQPALTVMIGAWAIGLLAVIALAFRSRLSAAFTLSLAYVIAFFVAQWVGERYLGWGP